MAKQPGLDGRHRDANGEIHRKMGQTRIDTLRKTYGDEFASRFRDKSLFQSMNQPSIEHRALFKKLHLAYSTIIGRVGQHLKPLGGLVMRNPPITKDGTESKRSPDERSDIRDLRIG
jgi:hypothetical protein